LPHQLFLFYSNRRPEDAAFLEELTTLQEKNHNFKLVATMTQMEKSKQTWAGETGYIAPEMIQKYVPSMNAVWYLSGPPVMVKTMRGILEKLGADEDFIRTEEFSGY
jgi:ferredoxin-NADP reductase